MSHIFTIAPAYSESIPIHCNPTSGAITLLAVSDTKRYNFPTNTADVAKQNYFYIAWYICANFQSVNMGYVTLCRNNSRK
jgi:hypothetical protein